MNLIQSIQPGGETKEIELKLTAMTLVNPATGWFEIVEVPYCNINDITNNEQDNIDKSSARISRLFDQTWLSRALNQVKSFLITDQNSKYNL